MSGLFLTGGQFLPDRRALGLPYSGAQETCLTSHLPLKVVAHLGDLLGVFLQRQKRKAVTGGQSGQDRHPALRQAPSSLAPAACAAAALAWTLTPSSRTSPEERGSGKVHIS